MQGCEGGVTLIADNPFTNKKELIPFETGIRIDYILFKVSGSSLSLLAFLHDQRFIFLFFSFLFSYLQGSSKVDLHCDSMVTTKGSIPDHPFPYSDHEALTSELRLEQHAAQETRKDQHYDDKDTNAGI